MPNVDKMVNSKLMFNSKLLIVRGVNCRVPKEISDYFEGKGISLEFLKKYYGLERNLCISPDAQCFSLYAG